MASESSTKDASTGFGFDLVASTLAHEIRNPLQAMRIQVDSAIRGASATDAIAQISKSLDRLEKVMNRVQKLSQKYQLQISKTNLRDVIENAIASSRVWLQAAGIEVSTQVQWEETPICEADSELLEQVILNLVSNSVQAMPTGGKLNIQISECEETAEIIVKDTGEGMDANTCQLIGTPFFTTKDGGSGLGVAFCKTIISLHKGSFEVESQLGVGTTITIRIPKFHSDEGRGRS